MDTSIGETVVREIHYELTTDERNQAWESANVRAGNNSSLRDELYAAELRSRQLVGAIKSALPSADVVAGPCDGLNQPLKEGRTTYCTARHQWGQKQ